MPSELMELAVRVHVRLMDGVLCVGVVAKDGARDAVQPLAVASHQHLELPAVAIEDLLHRLAVRVQWQGLHCCSHRKSAANNATTPPLEKTDR